MTLHEIAKIERDFLTPKEVAQILKCNPYAINLAVKQGKAAKLFPFPIVLIGNRAKIPKIPFLRAMGWEAGK